MSLVLKNGKLGPAALPARRPPRAISAPLRPPPGAARRGPSSGMRLPPTTCWLLLWLPPLAAQAAGAERGEEEAAAVSGNRAHGLRARAPPRSPASCRPSPSSSPPTPTPRPGGDPGSPRPGGAEPGAGGASLPGLRLLPRARPPWTLPGTGF